MSTQLMCSIKHWTHHLFVLTVHKNLEQCLKLDFGQKMNEKRTPEDVASIIQDNSSMQKNCM